MAILRFIEWDARIGMSCLHSIFVVSGGLLVKESTTHSCPAVAESYWHQKLLWSIIQLFNKHVACWRAVAVIKLKIVCIENELIQYITIWSIKRWICSYKILQIMLIFKGSKLYHTKTFLYKHNLWKWKILETACHA